MNPYFRMYLIMRRFSTRNLQRTIITCTVQLNTQKQIPDFHGILDWNENMGKEHYKGEQRELRGLYLEKLQRISLSWMNQRGRVIFRFEVNFKRSPYSPCEIKRIIVWSHIYKFLTWNCWYCISRKTKLILQTSLSKLNDINWIE